MSDIKNHTMVSSKDSSLDMLRKFVEDLVWFKGNNIALQAESESLFILVSVLPEDRISWVFDGETNILEHQRYFCALDSPAW